MNPSHSDGDPVDSLLEVVSHPMRRELLHTLEEGETTTVEALSRDLVDTDVPDGGQRPKEPSQVEMALHHHHLPRMADAGMIDYDPDTGTIETNDTIDVAYELLDSISERIVA